MTTRAKRIPYIDLAKGICITLVILDHVANEGYFSHGSYPLNEVFEQMRMPLYFVLSGLFFKDYEGGIWEFLLKKVNRILVPYLFFILLFRTVTWLVRNLTDFATTGADIAAIWGPLWFLRCLFFMNVIFAVVYYALRRTGLSRLVQDILLGASMLAIGVVGYHSGNLHLNFGAALTSMPLLWAGFVLNRRLHLLERRIPWWCAMATAVGIFVMLHYTYMGENYFYSNTFSSPWPLLYLVGFAGTMAILLLSSVIERLPILSYIGRYSIIVLCTHMVCVTLLVALRHYLPAQLQQTDWPQSLAFLVVTIAFSMLCCHFLRKYLPWFTAQKDLITADFGTRHTKAPQTKRV